MEFRKGVLFVRLSGTVNHQTYHQIKQINHLIQENGIKYMVLNVEELQTINEIGMNVLKTTMKLIAEHHGKCIICGHDEQLNRKLEQCLYIEDNCSVENELNALKLINI